MNTGKTILSLTKDKADLIKSNKEKDDIICAIKNENDVLSTKLKKFEDAQNNGYMTIVVDINTNLVLGHSVVEPYSNYTYVHDAEIMNILTQPGYVKYPCTVYKDNKIEIDNQLYKKYKTLGVMK